MGYHYLKELYANERRDYPEVASGVIEGIVCGLAGVDADVTANRITTLPRFTDATRWISIENIPVFSGKYLSCINLPEVVPSRTSPGKN